MNNKLIEAKKIILDNTILINVMFLKNKNTNLLNKDIKNIDSINLSIFKKTLRRNIQYDNTLTNPTKNDEYNSM